MGVCDGLGMLAAWKALYQKLLLNYLTRFEDMIMGGAGALVRTSQGEC